MNNKYFDFQQNIKNIFLILNPKFSDLAYLFDVSRQSIYKWLSGKSQPEEDKFDRIVALSQIADSFSNEGMSNPGHLLKMKNFNGRSLLELIKSGENRKTHVEALIREYKKMEAAYNRSGLLTSKAKPSDNWKSYISIPGYLI